MEKSEYFKFPKVAKNAIKRIANRSEEEQTEIAGRMHKTKEVLQGTPRVALLRKIASAERQLDMHYKSKQNLIRERIPQKESELKRLKAELESLQD